MRALAVTTLFLLAPVVAAQTYHLEVEPDHAPWATSDVDRFAVRLGNCMTWTVRVSDDSGPGAGVGVSVTDSEGRRSLVHTGSAGTVSVGTRTCWTTPRVVDHAFQVTGTIGGGEATSERVVHEVMWSDGQVYADVPERGEGTVTIPVWVVWSTTDEPMRVDEAVAVYGDEVIEVPLAGGEGSFQVRVRDGATLRVGVPRDEWPSGGPDAAVVVRDAGPFTIAEGSASEPGPDPEQDPDPEASDPPAGSGPPPSARPPQRKEQPPPATLQDQGEESDADDEGAEGGPDAGDDANRTDDEPSARDTPWPTSFLAVALLLSLAIWRRNRS